MSATRIATVLVLLCGGVCGCKTSGVIKANAPAEISRLDADFKLIVREGAAPLRIESEGEEVARFAIYPRGRSPRYLILVQPEKLSGEITIDANRDEEVVESAAEYNAYIDRLLAAHRAILRGDLGSARKTLDRLDENYLETHGSLMLRATIHAAEGNGEKVLENLELARLLYSRPAAKKK